MAKLEGITVEINGDATGLNSALKDTNKELSSTQNELNQVNKLLKLDPSNTTLLAQKQTLLSSAIKDTSSKLETLKQAQEQANKSGLTNTEAGQKAYRELEREIAKTEQSLDKLESELNDVGKASEKSSESTGRLGDIIKGNLASEAIIGGVKALASAVGSVVSQMVDLGKQAIESFAEYEQLVGGVETLFKDSADVVQDYANNAYKTAGISANQYMETVTSFSASLLQSLNNDTAESAKVADMAITDMADNANKMGTSMEMIQSAYQGFAKQNYTMLDNLKLGYGGTKTEMERLLKDATAISGVKYDISSLSDVYNAIHVIQGELGITGTTAKEASETISGSLNSMKASWQNLLTGIADDNADFGQLVDNFVDSILIAGENLLPRIEQVLDGMIELIVQLADKLLPQLLEIGTELVVKLVEGIVGSIGQITSSVTTIGVEFTKTILEILPQILEAGIQIILALVTGLADAIPELVPVIVDCVSEIVTVLIDNLPLIIDAAFQIIAALALGIIQALPELLKKLPEVIDSLVNFLYDNGPEIVESGWELLIALIEGLISAIPELIKALPKILESLVNGLLKGVTKMTEVGLQLIKGLFNGIQNARTWLYNKLTGWVDNVLDYIKGLFGIHSPSTVMRDEVGKMLGLGMAEGIEESTDDVLDVCQELNDKIIAKEEELTKKLDNDKLDKVTKKNLQSQLDAVKEFKKEYQSALNEIQKAQSKLEDKLKSFGQLFEIIKDEKYGEVLKLGDLQSDIDALNRYGDALEELKEKGASASLLDEILDMDVDDATKYMETLLSMTDEKYENYMNLWNEKQATAERIAREFYKSEFDSLSKEYIDKLPAELGKLKSEMLELGKLSAKGLGDGFESQYGYIESKMVTTLERAYEAAKEAMDVHSPSRLFAKLGSFMSQGVAVGFTEEMPAVINKISNAMNTITDAISTELDINAMPKVKSQITSQNYYTTNSYQKTTEVVRQPSAVTIEMDKKVLGQVMVPVLNERNKVLGANLSWV